MQDIQLYHGDCLEVMKKIPDKSIDLVLCDLPYGVMAAQWDKIIDFNKLWGEYLRITKDSGIFLLFGNGLFTVKLINSNLEMYKYKYVWLKRSPTLFVHAKNRPLVKYEDVIVFSKLNIGHKNLLGLNRMTYNPQNLIPFFGKMGGTNKRGKDYIKIRGLHKDYKQEYTNYPTDVLEGYPETVSNKKLHPNQKPTELLEFLIRTYTNEGSTVLDNCMGSGSTGVAAKNTGRKFIGIELDKEYFDIAKNRIENGEVEKKKQEADKNQLALF